MKFSNRIAAAAALALGTIVAGPSVASAGTSTATFGSAAAASSHFGSFGGTMSYDDATHVLKIVLSNNASKGYLTGFAFNIKGDAKATYLDGDIKKTRKDEDPFDDARKTKKKIVTAKPFGKYEAGTGLDGKFGAKKKVSRGVAAGASREFSFRLDGADGGLTASDFLSDPTGMSIVASFGVNKKKLDKVAGVLIPHTNLTTIDNTVPSDVPSNNGSNPPADAPVVIPPMSAPPVIDTTHHDESSAPSVVIDNGDGGLDQPGGNNGGSTPIAVPLPPAAWSALSTMGLFTAVGLRKKLRGLLGA